MVSTKSENKERGHPQVFQEIDACIDALLERVGREITVGTPLGLGKPVPLLNALYERVAQEPERRLTLLTALSVGRPAPASGLKQRLVGPIVERWYEGYPELAYVAPNKKGQLPENIQVLSFFFPTGQYKGCEQAQHDYISSNYSHVTRDLADIGLDAIVQMVSPPLHRDDRTYYSLGSNSDITLDLLQKLEDKGTPALLVGQVNREMPIMEGDALVPAEQFDYLLDHPRHDFTLFSLPETPVDVAEHMIGLHASTLIPDGGTLQIGIGSLGDALVHATLLRHCHNQRYQRILRDAGALPDEQTADIGGTSPFQVGLYANSEMFVHGLLHLFQDGVLKRAVFDHPTLQRWALEHAGAEKIPVTPELLTTLSQDGAIASPLMAEDVHMLQRWGVLSRDWSWQSRSPEHEPEPHLVSSSAQAIPATLDALLDHAHHKDPSILGDALVGGVCMHGAFFLGPTAMYEALRTMPNDQRAALSMSGVERINTLRHDRELMMLQRQHTRCFNIAMMHTLLGAATSDALEDGQVISGVGGQYDFVSMAHELPGARSILLVPSTRFSGGSWQSNIRWSYGHTTIPRHLRDIVITEYGVAVLRGKTDEECIQAMLAITDTRFQEKLRKQAVRAGKLSSDYRIPDAHRNNRPERLADALRPHQEQGWLPLFPLGTGLTEEEVILSQALQRLQVQVSTWSGRWELVKRGLTAPASQPSATEQRCLERMKLSNPQSWKERGLRWLLQLALHQYLEQHAYLHNPPQRKWFPLHSAHQ